MISHARHPGTAARPAGGNAFQEAPLAECSRLVLDAVRAAAAHHRSHKRAWHDVAARWGLSERRVRAFSYGEVHADPEPAEVALIRAQHARDLSLIEERLLADLAALRARLAPGEADASQPALPGLGRHRAPAVRHGAAAAAAGLAGAGGLFGGGGGACPETGRQLALGLGW